MKFFNIDQHVAVIPDLAQIFKNLGGHEVDDWSLSGHHWVLNKQKAVIPIGSGQLTCSGVCTQEHCDAFYEQYKEEFKKYDAFICCYPAEFALLYEKWNKPIIVINCIRYEHPNTFENLHILKRLNEFMAARTKDGSMYWVCSNRGDQWYTEHYTGIKGTLIPHLGEYTNLKYTGTKDKYIIHNRSDITVPSDLAIPLAAIRGAEWRYTWENLYSHKGVIHLPYSNTTSSINEQYAANMPLYFPTKQYCKELFYQGKTLEELTFYKINKKQEPDDINSPNSLRNPDILEKWIDGCDYYDEELMGGIRYFSSPSELEHMLRTDNLSQVSGNIAAGFAKRKQYAYEQWKKILDSIQSKT